MTVKSTPGLSPARLAINSMVWLALFSVIARSAGFFKEMALARRFGVGALTDAYVLGFTWATWLPGIFASVAMATLVPTLAHLAQNHSRAERRLFTQEFGGLTLLLGLGIGAATAAVPLLAYLGVPVDAGLADTLPSLALLVPAFFFAIYASTRLVAAHHHSNLALEAIPALTLTLVLLAPVDIDLKALCLATAAGYLLYTLAVLGLMQRHRESIALRFGFSARGWRTLVGAASALIIGNLCAGSLTVVDQSQAALLPEGSASILGYASRLLMLPAVLLSMLITRSMLPVFSDVEAAGRSGELGRLVRRFSAAAFAVGAAGAAFVWLFAPQLVAIAFERGSFVATDTAATASALRWGIPQLPFYLASLVLVQALLSRRQYVAVAVSGVFNLVAKLLLNIWLAPGMGVNGIMLATSIVLALSMLILFAGWLRSSPPGPARAVTGAPAAAAAGADTETRAPR